MKTTIHKWGNSLAVRIPRIFAMQMNIDMGEDIELTMDRGGLRITAARNLKALLDEITPENLHAETATGTTLGKELW